MYLCIYVCMYKLLAMIKINDKVKLINKMMIIIIINKIINISLTKIQKILKDSDQIQMNEFPLHKYSLLKVLKQNYSPFKSQTFSISYFK